jgi:hypothetical protein
MLPGVETFGCPQTMAYQESINVSNSFIEGRGVPEPRTVSDDTLNDIFESPNQRVAVCREQRRTGEFHPTCPLSPVLSKPCATPECNCDLSHYHLFLSLGLGSPSRVRAVPCPLARGVLPFLSGPDPAHPRTQSSNFKYERQQQRIEAKEQRKRQRSAAKQQKELDKMHEAAGLLSTVFEESDSDDEAAAGVYGGFDVLLTTAAMR